jgi:hypothetical protein
LKPFMALIAKILSRRKSPLYGILRDWKDHSHRNIHTEKKNQSTELCKQMNSLL